jgi:hypothetical protein
LLAPIWFCFGLIAPLTPSEGMPTLASLFVFWLVPMALLAGVWVWDHSVIGRGLSATLLVLILAFYSWLVLWPVLSSR